MQIEVWEIQVNTGHNHDTFNYSAYYDSLYNDDDDSGPNWTILIVVLSVLGLIGLVVVFYCIWKSHKKNSLGRSKKDYPKRMVETSTMKKKDLQNQSNDATKNLEMNEMKERPHSNRSEVRNIRESILDHG